MNETPEHENSGPDGAPAVPPPAPPPPPPPPAPPPAWGGTAGPPPGSIYGNPYGYGTTGLPRTSGLAIASMVLGIVSIVLCGITALIGLPMGYAAKKQIRESNGTITGDGMATAGIVLGWIVIGIALFVLLIALLGRH